MRYLKPAAFLLLLVGSSVPFLSRTAIAADDGPSTTPKDTSSQSDSKLPANTANAPSSAFAASQVSLGDLLDSASGEVNRSLLSSVAFSPTSSSLPSAPENTAGTLLLDSSTVKAPQFAQASRNDSPSTPAATANSTAGDSIISGEEGFVIEVQAQAPGSKELADMEDFRRLVQDAQAQTPSADEALPTLEETPPTEDPTPTTDAEPVDAEPGPESAPIDPSPADREPENVPAETGAELGAELTEVRESLISDPNPLSVPVFREEVDVDRNPLVTIDEAIELAYRNNQALQTSLLQLEQSEAALDEAKAALLPSATVQSTLSNQQAGGFEETGIDTNFQVSYDLLTGGARSASIRAAELQVDVSALAVEAQQEQLRLVTANLYYALQEAIEQIRINQSFVDEAERNLRDSELRQEVGVGTRFDVLRAEVQLANAQQALVQSQFNEDIARRDIARLLNLPPTAGLETTPVERAEDWPLDLEESVLLAFENRAELEQQLNQADISEQQRQIALAAIRPQVSLFATYGLDLLIDSDVGGEFGDLSDSTNFGVRLNWTLFNGGASRAAARQQEIGALIAEEQFSETLDQVRFDVEEAYFNIQANETNITTSNSAVIQAEAALELANLRLQAGVGTQLDVLSAQTELTQAQVNNVTAILGYNRALVAIQRAISNVGL